MFEQQKDNIRKNREGQNVTKIVTWNQQLKLIITGRFISSVTQRKFKISISLKTTIAIYGSFEICFSEHKKQIFLDIYVQYAEKTAVEMGFNGLSIPGIHKFRVRIRHRPLGQHCALTCEGRQRRYRYGNKMHFH